MQLVGHLSVAVAALSLLAACSSERPRQITPVREAASPSTVERGDARPDPAPGGDVAFAAPMAAPVVPRGTVSGHRLVARQLLAADGSAAPAGWYDRTMRVECAFERAADGWLRCLPTRTSRIDERGYHLDPGCSEPLAVADDGCAPAPFASRRAPDDRCGVERGVLIYEVGERTQPATVYVQAGDSCKAVPAPPGLDLYRTSPLPSARFVSARVVTP
jgi:hypothetical protein